jgi:hypothetical protein
MNKQEDLVVYHTFSIKVVIQNPLSSLNFINNKFSLQDAMQHLGKKYALIEINAQIQHSITIMPLQRSIY